MNIVKELVNERKEEYLNTLFTFLKQKSISAQNVGMTRMSVMVKEFMDDIGMDSKIIETEGYPVVFGEINNDNDFTLLIYGHYDVQPADPIEEWHTPPFEPHVRNGKIFARGAGDNKGQIIAQLLAIKSYQSVFGKLPINIKVVVEGEEEVGSPNLAEFVQKNKNLLKADLVYTSDGPMHASGAPFVLPGVRGMLYVELEAKGADWDNHSGNKGNIVPNPAWELIELLKTMRSDRGEILIKGFYNDIRKPTSEELNTISTLPYNKEELKKQIGYEGLIMSKEEYYKNLTMRPTFNIAGFHSGYTGEGAKTIIPARANVKIDFRLIANQDPEDIYEKLKFHVEKNAPSIKVNKLNAIPPSHTSLNLKSVITVRKAVEKAFNQKPVLQPSLGGSLPDYIWTKLLGTPSIIVPYANFDEANHSPNENIDIENFLMGIICTCQVIQELGEEGRVN